METMYHNPVLLHQSVDALVVNPDGIYVDCTFGGGGHSNEILARLSDKGQLFGFDQDPDAANNNLLDPRFTLIPQNFRYLKNFLHYHQITHVSGILADFGVSSFQFDEGNKGFSTRFDGPLDMRMNPNQPLSAKIIVNEYSEDQLWKIFTEYGELHQARRMAKEIVLARTNHPIESTEDLKNIFHYLPPNKKNKILAQLFQAIRIETNDELNALKELLTQSLEMLTINGALVLISYHSLEDRLAKKFLRTGMFEGEPERDLYGNWFQPFRQLQSKPIIPNELEIEQNNRARSAKLRVGYKQ